jgi:membrane-associated HD superfamily phosphohydrolase
MISWLLMTKINFGIINIETTGSDISMLVGNVVALLSPVIFIPILTLIKPDETPYDFVSMRAIELVDDGPGITQKPTLEETERGITLLKRNSKSARIMAIGLTMCLVVIWPWPMYGSSYIFSKSFFTGWIILGIVWMLFSFCIVGIYPIIENYTTILTIFKLMYADLIRIRQRTIQVNPHENNFEMKIIEKQEI